MIVRLLKDVIDLGVGAFGLFVLVLLAVAFELGFQVGRRRFARRPPPANEAAGVSTLITGMLGLMAFTLALTISFAQDRFETRRHTTLAEANTIGTAWLRTGLAGALGKPIAHRDRTDAPGRRHARRRRSGLPDRSRGATAAAAGLALARNAERRDGRDRRPQPATARIPPSRLGASGLDHPRFCAYFAMTMRADLRLFTNGRNEL